MKNVLFVALLLNVHVLGVTRHEQYALVQETFQKQEGVSQFVLSRAGRGFLSFRGELSQETETFVESMLFWLTSPASAHNPFVESIRAALGDHFQVENKTLEDGTVELNLLVQTAVEDQ